MIKVQHNSIKVTNIEKIISILSYITMGIVGLLWLIIAHIKNKKLRFFLMYNVVQSMVIAILLTIIKLCLDIILSILAKLPILDFIAAIIYYIISFKIIRFYSLGISFTAFELILFLLLIYIIIGIFLGRIFYIPYLSDFMNRTMKNYY